MFHFDWSLKSNFQGGFQVFYWPWALLQEKHYMWDGRHSALTFSIKTPQSPLQTRDSFKRLTCSPQQASTVAALMCFGSPVGLPSCPGSFQDEGHTLNYTSICRARVRMCVGWGEVGGERRGGRRERRKKKKKKGSKIVCVPEGNGPTVLLKFIWIFRYNKKKGAAGFALRLILRSSLQMERYTDSCQDLLNVIMKGNK